MSLIPVATAWVGEFVNDRDPEIFYLLIFAFWSYAYLFLSKALANQLENDGGPAEKIRRMFIYRFMNSIWYPVILVIMIIIVFVFPPIGLLIGLIEVIVNGIKTTPDSDQLDEFID